VNEFEDANERNDIKKDREKTRNLFLTEADTEFTLGERRWGVFQPRFSFSFFIH
jgi:hypothetical protein